MPKTPSLSMRMASLPDIETMCIRSAADAWAGEGERAAATNAKASASRANAGAWGDLALAVSMGASMSLPSVLFDGLDEYSHSPSFCNEVSYQSVL